MTVGEREFSSGVSLQIPRGAVVLLLVVAVLVLSVAAFTLLSPGSIDTNTPKAQSVSAEESWANFLELTGNSVSVKDTQHAVQKHGTEAIQIRRCLNRPGGTIDVWKFDTWRRPNQFFQVCQLEDGRMGLRLIEKLRNGIWKEKTSFVVKSGSPAEVLEYLTARATRWTDWLSSWRWMPPPS
jgi:hypothetical protein